MKSKIGVPVIIGLLISSIGIVSPIIWDRYKSAASLELLLLLNTKIIEKSKELEKLTIIYDGKQIESISRLEFILINSGRKPILAKDLIKKPTISLLHIDDILEFKVESLSPKNIEFNKKIDTKSGKIIIGFPLLNPSDFIRFSLLVAAEKPKFTADARITGIKEMAVVDRSFEKPEKTKKISFWIYLVAFFTLFLIGFFWLMVPELPKDLRARRKYKNSALLPTKNVTKNVYEEILEKDIKYKTEPELMPIKKYLSNIKDDEQLNSEKRKYLDDLISNLLKERDIAWELSLISLFFICVGITFIVVKLL